MNAIEKCPEKACGRVGDEVGKCGSFATCPIHNGGAAVSLSDNDVVVHCEPCGLTRACSAPALLRGKSFQATEHLCQRDEDSCQAQPRMPRPVKGPQSQPAKAPASKAGDAQGEV